MTIQLRLAAPADTAALADLGRRAITAKFAHLYKPEDFATFLESAHSEAKVAKELADPGMRIAVLEEKGALIAFCKLVLTSTLSAGYSDALSPLELKRASTPIRRGSAGGSARASWTGPWPKPKSRARTRSS